ESYSYFRNYYSSNVIEYKGKKTIVNNCFNADDKIFEMFPFDFIEGNPKVVLKDELSVVISDELATELFGAEKNLVGKTIRINNLDFTLKGVYHIPGSSSVAPKLVFNSVLDDLEGNKGQWGNFNFGLVFKLKENVDKTLVEKKVEDIYFEYRTKFWAKEEGISVEEYIELYGQVKIILQPLETAYMHGVSRGYPEGMGNYQLLLIMFGISLLILVLSLVNYINLATANAIRRAKEVGVRKIVGANKSDVIKQFVFETSITAFIAIILSLAITELTLPYYNDFVNRDLSLNGTLFFTQLVLVFVLVVVFAGIFPALYVANFEALKVLKGNFSRSKSGIWVRNAMLVLQFAIASLFIIGSYIVYQQVDFMSKKDLGFQGDQVIRVKYRNQNHRQLYKDYVTFKQELLKIKGVENVAAGTFEIGFGSNSTSSFSHERKSTQAQNMAIDFGMLDLMNIKIVEGRDLSEKYASDSLSTMLVNKKFVEKLQLKNPVGTIISTGWGRGDDSDDTIDLEIVGVV